MDDIHKMYITILMDQINSECVITKYTISNSFQYLCTTFVIIKLFGFEFITLDEFYILSNRLYTNFTLKAGKLKVGYLHKLFTVLDNSQPFL